METSMTNLMRELDSRISNGIHIRLLWCEPEARLSVAVTDTKTGESFVLEVRDDERALDVFHHPYAYAACHGVDTFVVARASEASEESEELAAAA
jgi:hypothetical protein